MWKMKSILINISDEQHDILKSLIRREITDHCMSGRALIILLTAAGEKRLTIANRLAINPRVVTKWKKRFVAYAIGGKLDMPRSGRPCKYNDETEFL
jgi:hypothetical protein